MERFATLRENVYGYKGDIMSKPIRRLNREIKKCKLTETHVGRLKFQVHMSC